MACKRSVPGVIGNIADWRVSLARPQGSVGQGHRRRFLIAASACATRTPWVAGPSRFGQERPFITRARYVRSARH
jgi:hypothetical protein